VPEYEDFGGRAGLLAGQFLAQASLMVYQNVRGLLAGQRIHPVQPLDGGFFPDLIQGTGAGVRQVVRAHNSQVDDLRPQPVFGMFGLNHEVDPGPFASSESLLCIGIWNLMIQRLSGYAYLQTESRNLSPHGWLMFG
jgi:hypothetical protein